MAKGDKKIPKREFFYRISSILGGRKKASIKSPKKRPKKIKEN